MAGYAYRSLAERQRIQAMVEAGKTAKDISAEMGISLSAVYSELKRGRDGTRYADARLCYKADVAQLNMQKSIERRGRRSAGA